MDGNELFQNNIDLAKKRIVLHYPNMAGDQDAIQHALIGLWKASESFCADRGVSFKSYAIRCIDNSVGHYIRTEKRKVRAVSLDAGMDSECNGSCELVDKNDAIGDAVTMQSYMRLFKALPNEIDSVVAEHLAKGEKKRDVALRLGITESACYRSCARLKKAIEENERRKTPGGETTYNKERN